jgi:hypothetical protein
MASIGIFDKMQNTSSVTYNNILQVVTASSNAISTVTDSTTVALGTAVMTSAPVSTEGIQLLTLTFQPKYASSKILLFTSSLDVRETSNVADEARLSAFAGSTLLGWRTSYFNPSMGNNFAFGFHLHCMANAWGTDSRTVQLRINMGGGGSNYQFNNRYTSSWLASTYRMTVMEIQT